MDEIYMYTINGRRTELTCYRSIEKASAYALDYLKMHTNDYDGRLGKMIELDLEPTDDWRIVKKYIVKEMLDSMDSMFNDVCVHTIVIWRIGLI